MLVHRHKVETYDGTTLLSAITAQEFREDLKSADKETENVRLITRFLQQFETAGHIQSR